MTPVEWDCFDGVFGFEDGRDLEPGVLDDDAIHVFRNGHCHSLAMAIWKLVPCAELIFAYDFCEGDVEAGFEEEEEVRGHVLVRIEGRYLDACGWLDEHENEAEHDLEERWCRVTVIEPLGWEVNSDGWLDLRTEDAYPFALALLDKVGVEVSGDDRLAVEKLTLAGCA